MKEENLKLYNDVKSVPKNATKDFDNGSFKGTDINSMWRIKTLTENFGICGIGWYYEIKNKWLENIDDQVISNVEIELFIKQNNEWSKPIIGIGGNKLKAVFKSGKVVISDEHYKMALTDAIGNACKSLGFGADIYWATDKTKYSSVEKDEEPKATDKQIEMIESLLTDEELEKTKQKYGENLEKLDIKMASKIIGAKKQ
jgi:hypothetical protein